MAEEGMSDEARRRMAQWQEAILDALPAHIALLDHDGTILAVNASWKRFASANGFRGEDFGVGSNYVAVAERAYGDSAEEAAHAARGLRAVLAGEAGQFEMEYPCHSPEERRWFRLAVTPLRVDGVAGAVAMHVNVTERKRAEEALRRSEERFRAMIEYGSDIISLHDADGTTLYQSPSVRRILGYEPEELAGEKVLDYIHPEERRRTAEEIDKVRGGAGTHEPFETRFRHRDGSWRWFECTGTNLLDNPAVGKILFNARDITRRKLAEDELRASEAEMRALLAAMDDVIFVLDSEGRYLKVAPTNPDILYRPPGELIGRRLHEVFPPPEADFFLDHVRRALATGRRVAAEYGLHIAGRELLFAATVSPMTEDSVVWVARDVTDVRRAEAELRERETLYRETVENANDIIYTIDLGGRFISVNRAGERLTGYDREEMGRMTLADVVAPEYVDFVRAKMLEKVGGAGETRYETEIVARDGRRKTVEVNSRLIEREGAPAAVLGIARDVTERKQAEEKLRQTEDHLRQSQKLESVGRLAGGIAHDFNNMLTAINGYSDLILRNLGEDDPLRPKVEEIKKAGTRAAALTHQLLAFSRKQILRPKVLNLNEIIADTGRMLQRLIGEDVELLNALSPQLGRVEADPGQITQVLMNLAVNARDAMPEGGRLTIETENVYLDEAYAGRHVAVAPGRYVLLSVSDTGAGMDAETQKHIFEPFFTTKEVGVGTGMGLATVYGIVKQSKGSIWVYSEPGHGSTFKIYLPRVDGRAEAEPSAEAGLDLPRGTERILLVEDEDVVRALIRQILEMCGYAVLEAPNGAEAVRMCEEEGCEADLLITDVVMPQMGGRELVGRLARSRPAMRALYISGYTDGAIVHHGVLEEGANFIQKPFTPEALARKVRSVLDS